MTLARSQIGAMLKPGLQCSRGARAAMVRFDFFSICGPARAEAVAGPVGRTFAQNPDDVLAIVYWVHCSSEVFQDQPCEHRMIFRKVELDVEHMNRYLCTKNKTVLVVTVRNQPFVQFPCFVLPFSCRLRGPGTYCALLKAHVAITLELRKAASQVGRMHMSGTGRPMQDICALLTSCSAA